MAPRRTLGGNKIPSGSSASLIVFDWNLFCRSASLSLNIQRWSDAVVFNLSEKEPGELQPFSSVQGV